ncbi:MAG: hypothetical protein GY679_01825 [Mycoplasma sp.]|nr:hypothetical protein [Mycoplasma sp.]
MNNENIKYTNYFGVYSEISKKWITNIRTVTKKQAQKQLDLKLGWDAAKVRFSIRQVPKSQVLQEMVVARKKLVKMYPFCNEPEALNDASDDFIYQLFNTFMLYKNS